MVKIITDCDGEVKELTGDFAVGVVMSASEENIDSSTYLIGDANEVDIMRVLAVLTSEVTERVSEATGHSQAKLVSTLNTELLRRLIEKNDREGGETDENLKNHNE